MKTYTIIERKGEKYNYRLVGGRCGTTLHIFLGEDPSKNDLGAYVPTLPSYASSQEELDRAIDQGVVLIQGALNKRTI